MTDILESLAGVVILAGGNSRRMGMPKARLTLPTTESLLDYHVRQAIDLNVPIMIADNERGFTVNPELLSSRPELPIFHISDYSSAATNSSAATMSNDETEGPLVAIESALQSLAKQSLANLTDAATLKSKQSSWLMVISCDSLIPATELWQQLQLYIIPAVNDNRSKTQPSIQTADKSVICLTDKAHLYPLLGIYRLSIESDLLSYIDSGQRQVMKFINPMVQAIPVAKQWQQLTNFNTPEDFKRACAALSDL